MIKINQITGKPMWMATLSVVFKVLIVLVLLIVIPLIIMNIAIIIQPKDQVSSFMGYSMLNVVSGSMKETLDVGDMIVIRKTKEVREQDIVTFIDGNGSVVTHRVIKIEEENGETKYTTKGDNNNVEDNEIVKKEQIQGKVVYHLGGFGKLVAFLQKPQGLILLIGLPVLLMSVTKYFDIRFTNKKLYRKQQRVEYMESHQ